VFGNGKIVSHVFVNHGHCNLGEVSYSLDLPNYWGKLRNNGYLIPKNHLNYFKNNEAISNNIDLICAN